MHLKNNIKIWITVAVFGLILEGWAFIVVSASPEHWRPSMIVKDEPVARALYEKMIETLRKTENLSYQSKCSAPDDRVCTYLIQLKKPSAFRIEVTNDPSTKINTFVGNDDWLWIYWQGVRPYLIVDDQEGYEQTRSEVYIKKANPVGKDSIAREIDLLGIIWHDLILDPSTFHGYTDSLELYIDGIRSRGPHHIRGEECEIIEVSYMKALRTRYFWISKEDHLPRQIKQIDRLAENHVRVEEWSDIKSKTIIPEHKVTWSPPDGWRQWNVPGPDDVLLKSGQKAPDFDLLSVDGGRIRLSDYRGKIIWLCAWQCGCPGCRKVLPDLQKLYEENKDQDLIVLGFNYTDDKQTARRFIRESALTFPNILDSTEDAKKIMLRDYRNKTQTLPLHYIIDAQGNVMDAWCGYVEGHE
jgi:peroxiredoxin